MKASLEWRSLPYEHSKYFVVGTEIAAAYVPGTLSRFLIVETRGYPRLDGPGDVYYALRDAVTVSDSEVRDGRCAKIVARFDTPDDAVNWALARV